jgi:glycosyltransferase involved in cell wall biosynthesis
VRVVTLDRRPTDDAPLTEGGPVPTIRLPRFGPRRYPAATGLRDATAGVDVVHVFGVDGLLDALLVGRHPPIGVSTAGLFHHGGGGAVQEVVLRLWTRRQLRRVDGLWFTSEADARLLPGLAGRVLPPGLDLGPLLRLPRRPEPGRWLLPGRIDRHKGHAACFRAVARLRDRPHLRVVGGGDAGPLRPLARGLGLDVAWLGEVDDAAWADELCRAERAIFPSTFESFGMAVVEAMAAGLSVVVHPGGALAERVEDGVDGRVVDFSDPRRAAEGLMRPWTEEMGRTARSRASRFDWSVRLADHEAAWTEAAA